MISHNEVREPSRAALAEVAEVSGRSFPEIREALRSIRARRLADIPGNTILNLSEAAWVLAVSRWHLRELINEGKVTARRRDGRWEVRLGDVLALDESRRSRFRLVNFGAERLP